MTGVKESFAVLRSARFRFVTLADVASSFGSGATMVVLLVLIARWDGASGVSAYLVVTGLASLALGTFAGVAADRGDRRLIVVLADAARAPLAIALVTAPRDALWFVLVISALRSAVGTFAAAADLALLPSLVAESQLGSAFSLSIAANNVARVAGMGLGGWLVSAGHPAGAFVVDAASFLVAAVLRWQVGPSRAVAADPTVGGAGEASPPRLRRFTRDTASGWRHTVGNGLLRRVLYAFAAISVSGAAVNVLFVVFVVRQLHASPSWLAVIEACGVTSMILSALVAGTVIAKWGAVRTLAAGIGLAAGCTSAVAAVHQPGWLVLIDPLWGLGAALAGAAAPVVITAVTPDALLGRTQANAATFANFCGIASIPLIGIASSWLGVRATFLWAGLLAVAVALIIALRPHVPTAHRDDDTEVRAMPADAGRSLQPSDLPPP